MSLMSPDPDQPSGLLRGLPEGAPPAALDHAILRAAREAPHVRAAAAPVWLRWLRDWRNGWPIASVAGTAAGAAWSTGGWTSVIVLTAIMVAVGAGLAASMRRVPSLKQPPVDPMEQAA